MELMLGFVVALSVTMALIPPLMQAASRYGFLDLPETRKVHANPIPRVGGIAMAIGVLLALLLWGDFERAEQAFCAALLVLLAFGVWDDRVTLDAGPKFLGQGIAVLIAMVWGDVSIASVTMAERHVLPEWLAAPLTFVFLIGVTNAINLSDGLDGLAGGTTLLCLCALGLLGLTFGDLFVGEVALIVAGAILGFLRYNTHPARVFMGDAGSQILGFSVAVLSVRVTQDPEVALSSALPLLLLGMPIIDTFMVMTERVLAGHSPFKADKNHIHHRLLALGFDHHEAVMIIYGLQALLFVCGWFLRYEPDLVIVLVFLSFALGIVSALRYLQGRGWRLRTTKDIRSNPTTALSRHIAWLTDESRLPRWALWLMAVVICVYAALVLVAGPRPPRDVAGLIALLSVAVLARLLWRPPLTEIGWVEKAAFYTCAALAVYLEERGAAELQQFACMEWVVFPLLAIAVAIRVRLSSTRRFTLTTLDMLVVVVALLIPNLPGSIATPSALGIGVAKLVTLFYSLETLSVAVGRYWRWMSLAALVFLGASLLRLVQ